MCENQFPKDLKNYQKAELAGIKMPNDFDPKSAERIEIFRTRLNQMKQQRSSETKNKKPADGQDALLKLAMKDRADFSQRALAKELNCTEMTVSKYFRGDFKSIPMHHLARIANFFSVSSHYLVGYVDNPDYCLALTPDGEIEHLPDGSPRLLLDPMDFWPASAVEAANRYQALYQSDPGFYWLLDKLIQSPASVQKKYRKILEILLNE